MARSYSSSSVQAEIVGMVPSPEGIQGCICTSIKFTTPEDERKRPYLQITFKQLSTGAVYSEFISEIDEENAPSWLKDPKVDEKGRTALSKAYDQQMIKLKHIFGALTGIDYDKVEVSGESFKELCENFMKGVDYSKLSTIPIHWLKLIWKKKADGSGRIAMADYPPMLSTTLKPRPFIVSKYEKDKEVFKQPVGVAPDQENDLAGTPTNEGDDYNDTSDTSYSGETADEDLI